MSYTLDTEHLGHTYVRSMYVHHPSHGVYTGYTYMAYIHNMHTSIHPSIHHTYDQAHRYMHMSCFLPCGFEFCRWLLCVHRWTWWSRTCIHVDESLDMCVCVCVCVENPLDRHGHIVACSCMCICLMVICSCSIAPSLESSAQTDDTGNTHNTHCTTHKQKHEKQQTSIASLRHA